MKMKLLGAFCAVFLCAINLNTPSFAEESEYTDYSSEEFLETFQDAAELQTRMSKRKNEVCDLPLEDFGMNNDWRVLEEGYEPSFCTLISNSIVALSTFLKMEWHPSRFEGVASGFEVEEIKPALVPQYLNAHKRFSDEAQRVLRIVDRGLATIPKEFRDEEEEALLIEDLREWADNLTYDVELALAEQVELKIAWDDHTDRTENASKFAKYRKGYWQN